MRPRVVVGGEDWRGQLWPMDAAGRDRAHHIYVHCTAHHSLLPIRCQKAGQACYDTISTDIPQIPGLLGAIFPSHRGASQQNSAATNLAGSQIVGFPLRRAELVALPSSRRTSAVVGCRIRSRRLVMLAPAGFAAGRSAAHRGPSGEADNPELPI
jgi:hypothetical protein